MLFFRVWEMISKMILIVGTQQHKNKVHFQSLTSVSFHLMRLKQHA